METKTRPVILEHEVFINTAAPLGAGIRTRAAWEHPPGGGVAGDDGDVGLLWLAAAVGVGGGAQAGRALLVNQVLATQKAFAVVRVVPLLVFVNHPDVLGHLFELVGQSLTLHLGQDAPLVVIPASSRTQGEGVCQGDSSLFRQ